MLRKFLFIMFLIGSVIAKAAITTPYPESIVIKQINSAEKERVRLCQGHKKYDKQPTGFYVAAGKKVVVNVEILTAADKNVMPALTVGTLGFNVDGRNTGTVTTLKAGTNTITSASGGLIWLSFVQDGSEAPKGEARITFITGSEHERAPRYVHGVTTDLEFAEMYDKYQTPDVVYESDYALMAATRDAARLYSYSNNANGTVLRDWMNSILVLLETEDEISGMNDNDPNPVHHRLKAKEVRYLLVQNTSASPHANSSGYTGYPNGSRNRYLTKTGTTSNGSWMLGHELGHQHQQPAYQINGAGESTVNIYSYVVERYFQAVNFKNNNYNRTSAERWAKAQEKYLNYPFSKRIYDMPDAELEGLVGFNRDELRFMVWEQLFLVFGDQFYKNLHRVVREEKVSSGGAADERRAYLIWKASQVSGYDLTEFFNLWGIRVTDTAIKAKLRARIGKALAKAAIIPLPVTAEECTLVTGQARPSWTPLPLKGITTSSPEGETSPIDRSDWTIVTSVQGAKDNAVLGELPEYIIDSNTGTAFLFVKPGKTHEGISVPSDHIPSFTIDMKSTKSFNYVAYMHRLLNNSTYLRARQLSIYGSNNNSEFTPVYEHYVIDYVKNSDEVIIEFPAVSYRYIKVVIEDWDKNNGNTIQVAEFKAGTKTPEEVLPVPAPLKFKVNVKTDSFVTSSQEGVNLADEDSNYTVDFTLLPGAKSVVVKVDGDVKPWTVNQNVYSVSVKVTNHTDIDISAQEGSGIDIPTSNPEIKVYPGQAKAGQPFNISLGDGFTDAVVSIYSILGEKLSEKTIVGNENEQTVYQRVVYILEVRKNNTKNVLKFIVN